MRLLLVLLIWLRLCLCNPNFSDFNSIQASIKSDISSFWAHATDHFHHPTDRPSDGRGPFGHPPETGPRGPPIPSITLQGPNLPSVASLPPPTAKPPPSTNTLPSSTSSKSSPLLPPSTTNAPPQSPAPVVPIAPAPTPATSVMPNPNTVIFTLASSPRATIGSGQGANPTGVPFTTGAAIPRCQLKLRYALVASVIALFLL